MNSADASGDRDFDFEEEGADAMGVLSDWIEDFDFEGMVRRYPLSAVALAVLGGFMIGRTRGDAVMAALSAYAAGQVAERVNTALGSEVL
jgi:hypothetical protein